MRCFSVKDPGPKRLHKRVVYKFVCAGCNAYFIGETIFTFNIREKVTPSWSWKWSLFVENSVHVKFTSFFAVHLCWYLEVCWSAPWMNQAKLAARLQTDRIDLFNTMTYEALIFSYCEICGVRKSCHDNKGFEKNEKRRLYALHSFYMSWIRKCKQENKRVPQRVSTINPNNLALTTPYSQVLQFCQKHITYSETFQARNNYDILI